WKNEDDRWRWMEPTIASCRPRIEAGLAARQKSGGCENRDAFEWCQFEQAPIAGHEYLCLTVDGYSEKLVVIRIAACADCGCRCYPFAQFGQPVEPGDHLPCRAV